MESKEIRSRFSTLKEQWPSGAAESTVNSVMMIARTVMAESGPGGRLWFKAALAGKDARNVTFKERIWMTQHQAMYGEKQAYQISEHWAAELGYIYTSSDEKRKAHAQSHGRNIRWWPTP